MRSIERSNVSRPSTHDACPPEGERERERQCVAAIVKNNNITKEYITELLHILLYMWY